MGIFAKLRDRSKIIKFIVKAQKTVWYPIIFAALCIVSGLNDHSVYIPIMYILSLFVLFSALFTDDNKVFFTPLFMMFFALGRDNADDAFYDSEGDMLAFMNENALKHIVVIGIIAVGAFLIRLTADGSLFSVFKKRRHFTYGIIALDIAFMLNGVLSPNYSTVNLAYGTLMAMGITAVYFTVLGMLDSSSDPIPYACRAAVCAAYVALIQIMTVSFRLHMEDKFLIMENGSLIFNKDCIVLGWGVSTVIAGIFILGIPAAMFLARNSRFNILLYISSILFVVGAFVINTRGSMLIGTFIFTVCSVICCIKGKNRVLMRICLALTLAAAVAFAVFVHFKVMPIGDILDLFRIESIEGTKRDLLWKNGFEDFRTSPVFGAGFNDGGYDEIHRQNNFYSNMYHCILIQFPGAMGITGCIAFLIHLYQLASLTVRKLSSEKFLLMLIPITVLGASLFDNFFFYLDFQLFYGAFLALAEICLNQNTEKNKMAFENKNS